jgi:hypothetical protein
MWRRVALVKTDVSEELNASIIRVTRIGELGTTSVARDGHYWRSSLCRVPWTAFIVTIVRISDLTDLVHECTQFQSHPAQDNYLPDTSPSPYNSSHHCVEVEILIAVVMKSSTFWDIMSVGSQQVTNWSACYLFHPAFFACSILRPWRWRWYFPVRLNLNGLHYSTNQKTKFLSFLNKVLGYPGFQ